MSALTKITARAKQLRKKKPSLKYQDAVKAAAKEYKAGKLGKVSSSKKTTKSKTTVKKTGAKYLVVYENKSGVVKTGTVTASNITIARKDAIAKKGSIGKNLKVTVKKYQ